MKKISAKTLEESGRLSQSTGGSSCLRLRRGGLRLGPLWEELRALFGSWSWRMREAERMARRQERRSQTKTFLSRAKKSRALLLDVSFTEKNAVTLRSRGSARPKKVEEG